MLGMSAALLHGQLLLLLSIPGPTTFAVMLLFVWEFMGGGFLLGFFRCGFYCLVHAFWCWLGQHEVT